MQRSPLIVAATVVLASLAWALVLVFGSGPLAGSSAALLATDLLILGTVIAIGFALVRGRWTRWTALALLGAEAIVGIFFEVDGWWIAAVALTAIGIGALAGPWLDGWMRRLPGADGPSLRALSMSLGLIALPAVVAVTAPEGVRLASWVLSGFALIAAWGYSQAWLPALWAVRVALPVLGVVAVAGLSWSGALAVGLSVALLTALAWAPDVLQATLPGQTTHANLVPIPRELAPPEVLEAAGLDEKGRPREPEKE